MNVFDALVYNTRAFRDNHETKWKPELLDHSAILWMLISFYGIKSIRDNHETKWKPELLDHSGILWMLISFYGIRWQASESFMRPNGDLRAVLDLGGSTSWSWWYHFLCRQYLYHFSIRFRWMSLIFMSTISMGGSPHLCGVYLQISPCSTEVRWPSKNSRAAPIIFASLGS